MLFYTLNALSNSLEAPGRRTFLRPGRLSRPFRESFFTHGTADNRGPTLRHLRRTARSEPPDPNSRRYRSLLRHPLDVPGWNVRINSPASAHSGPAGAAKKRRNARRQPQRQWPKARNYGLRKLSCRFGNLVKNFSARPRIPGARRFFYIIPRRTVLPAGYRDSSHSDRGRSSRDQASCRHSFHKNASVISRSLRTSSWRFPSLYIRLPSR